MACPVGGGDATMSHGLGTRDGHRRLAGAARHPAGGTAGRPGRVRVHLRARGPERRGALARPDLPRRHLPGLPPRPQRVRAGRADRRLPRGPGHGGTGLYVRAAARPRLRRGRGAGGHGDRLGRREAGDNRAPMGDRDERPRPRPLRALRLRPDRRAAAAALGPEPGRGRYVPNSALTPSSRTGRRPANRSSADRAASSITAASRLAADSVTPCVSVTNGAYRTFTTTRTAGLPSTTRSAASNLASRATSACTCDQSAMFCWNVSSLPCPRARYGESSTSASPRPRPSRTSHGPVIGPNTAASASGSAAARSLTVLMPSPASFLAVLAPMPHSASVGRSPKTENQFADVSRNTPAGLPNPVAILACSLFSPIPTVQSSWVAACTRAAKDRANASGSDVSTPRNASSQPSTSTTAPEARSTSMTEAETSS